ncbi:Dephospho-CoA kinase [Rubripirellula lacrimiformis]|uniref:Dephospho-CoA kinase n=1 Tax=Rubripirellula lacrimiformis TaxID=1930273 RepID=A0A517NDQ8_9BACT|nr:dephospho-CoA kinase [Rubripirellula lacrimiformis]QDT05264.1 Dephospho-CoA kinase [Rubripirellula lacrimiformis]
MLVIGIVGSPAGGKSTVASQLQELGATWINADLIARDVLQTADVQAKLIRHFGNEIAGNDGQIDRSKLALRVFGADDAKRDALLYLESVVHPRTRQTIDARLRQAGVENRPAAILDVPLLFESGWDVACDEIWCVDSSFPNRLDRASRRGWDADELKRRQANQLDINIKKQNSTLVLENNDSLDQLIHSVRENYQALIQRQSMGAAAMDTDHCI